MDSLALKTYAIRIKTEEREWGGGNITERKIKCPKMKGKEVLFKCGKDECKYSQKRLFSLVFCSHKDARNYSVSQEELSEVMAKLDHNFKMFRRHGLRGEE